MHKCLECSLEFEKLNGFNRHIKKEHGLKEYYDKYLKKENEDFCKVCNKPTEFYHFLSGYKNCCSRECIIKYTQEQTEKGNVQKYGVKNAYQRKDIKKKIKKTCLEHWGTNMPLQNKDIKEKAYKTMEEKYGAKTTLESHELNEKVKKTNKEKYGDENAAKCLTIRNKMKETNIEKFGCENPLGNKNIREKRKKTMKKRYGSEHALRNKTCRDKFKQTCLKKYGMEYPCINAFKTQLYFNIRYQGSYELDFLQKYFNKYTDIKRGPTIKYSLENKEHLYFPDFYIPSLNLIIECKNLYLYKKDETKIKAKEKATIANGFKYCLIIDKKYDELETLLS